MVYVPRAFYRAAGRSCVNQGRNISFSRASFSGLAAVAVRNWQSRCCVNDGAALFLPKLLGIMLIWCKGTKVWWFLARYAVAVAGCFVLRIAGAGAYAVSYRVCGQRVPRRRKWSGTHRNATMILRREEEALYASRLSTAAGAAECGRWVWRGWIYAFCSVAGADCLFADSVSPFVSVNLQSFGSGLRKR